MDTIPTVTETIEETIENRIVRTVYRMSDGNFNARVSVIGDDGYRHYQGGRYFRTETEARDFAQGMEL